MNNELQTEKPKSKNSTGAPVRVSNETKKILTKLLDKANKKSFGKRIKPDALIATALKLVADNHLKKLQENSLSNADRLEMAFKEYKKGNSSASKDDFLGRLLDGESDNSLLEKVTNVTEEK